METELVTLVSQFGFPIAVSVWLLLDSKKTSKSLEKNTEVLGELKTVIAIHTATINTIEEKKISANR
jgi:hypothetical protein